MPFTFWIGTPCLIALVIAVCLRLWVVLLPCMPAASRYPLMFSRIARRDSLSPFVLFEPEVNNAPASLPRKTSQSLTALSASLERISIASFSSCPFPWTFRTSAPSTVLISSTSARCKASRKELRNRGRLRVYPFLVAQASGSLRGR